MIARFFKKSSSDQLTKRQVKAAAEKAAVDWMEGGESALDAFIRLRRLEEAVKAAKAKLEEQAMLEFERNEEGGSYKLGAANVSVRNGYAQRDYSQDLVYAEYERKLRARKAELDLVAKGNLERYGDDGVKIPVVQVKGYTKDNFKIDF